MKRYLIINLDTMWTLFWTTWTMICPLGHYSGQLGQWFVHLDTILDNLDTILDNLDTILDNVDTILDKGTYWCFLWNPIFFLYLFILVKYCFFFRLFWPFLL